MLRYIPSHINLHKFMTTETDSWYPQVILIGNERTKILTSLINDFEIESYDNSQAAVKIITLYCQVDKMSIYLKRQNHTFTSSYYQPPNLGVLLQRKNATNSHFTKRCNGKRCQICKIIREVHTMTMENGVQHKINSDVNCNSKYVIYCLECQCGATYIGETIDFRQRVNLHREQIVHHPYRHL